MARPRKRSSGSKSQKKPPEELRAQFRSIGGVGRCCCILGIDPGEKSGWALLARSKRIDSGTASSAALRHKVISFALAHSNANQIPLVVVMEDWTAGGWPSAKVMFGMGAARGRWLEQLDLIDFPQRRLIMVSTSTWRPPVLGKGYRISKSQVPSQSQRRDMLKQKSMDAASRIFNMNEPPGPDEADALCIAYWATQADATIFALKPELREIAVKFFIPRVYTGGRAS